MCSSSLSCSSYQFLITSTICIGHCHLGRCRHHHGIIPGSLDEQDLPKCSGNLCCSSYHEVQRWGEEIPRCGCPDHHWPTVLHCGKKPVSVVGFLGLPPHINSPCGWEKRNIGLVGEYHLLPLVYRPTLVFSTSLQLPLNVDSRKQRLPGSCSSMISGFI